MRADAVAVREREKGDIRPAGARLGARVDLWGIGGLLGFLLIWELLSRAELIDPVIFSSPSASLRFGWDLARDGSLWDHLRISGIEFLIGFALAVAAGIPFGIAYGWFRIVNRLLGQLLWAAYATPLVALVPFFIIVFGIGPASKVAIVFVAAIFPIVINVATGMNNLDPRLVRMARAFGASDWRLFLQIGLPSSLPYLLAGIRLGVGRGLIGVIVGELYASSAGIGFLLNQGGQTLVMEQMYFAVFVVALVGIAMMRLLDRLEARLGKWKS